MSTRGLVGIKHDNKYFGIYNHQDSYPEGLGANFLDMIKEILPFGGSSIIKDINQIVKNVNDIVETFDDEDVDNTVEYLKGVLLGKKHKINNDIDFIKDSLFCEYAYFIDFDENQVLVYKGGQTYPDPDNPFGEDQYNDNGYYPCSLSCKISLHDVVKKDTKELINHIKYGENNIIFIF